MLTIRFIWTCTLSSQLWMTELRMRVRNKRERENRTRIQKNIYIHFFVTLNDYTGISIYFTPFWFSQPPKWDGSVNNAPWIYMCAHALKICINNLCYLNTWFVVTVCSTKSYAGGFIWIYIEVSYEFIKVYIQMEKGMVIHSRTLAWRIPWTDEPGGLQSMESHRVGQDWAANTHTYTKAQK